MKLVQDIALLMSIAALIVSLATLVIAIRASRGD